MGKRPARFGDYSRTARFKILRDRRRRSVENRLNINVSDSSDDEINSTNRPALATNVPIVGEADGNQLSDELSDDGPSLPTRESEESSTSSDDSQSDSSSQSLQSPSSRGSASSRGESDGRRSPDRNEDFDGSDQDDSSGDSDDSNENAEPPGPNDPPLYPGARISEGDSMVAILTFTLTHKLSGACLSDLLELIQLHCPQPNLIHASMYRFKKYFSDLRSPLRRHYYCKYCNSELNGKDVVCERCNENMGADYFITVPLFPQMQSLFKREDFLHKISGRFERRKHVEANLEDIYDGNVYKELSQPGQILSVRQNISFAWYTDGVPIFRSSKFSIWPLYFSIMELPYVDRTRVENVILAGLWFGHKKPITNLFLRPLELEVNQLKNGRNFVTQQGLLRVKAIIIGGTCDLPAKAIFLNMKQFNGKHGCQKCKIPGVLERPGRGAKRIYPFVRNLQLRNDGETERFAAEAAIRGSAVFGVKGPTVLRRLVAEPIRTTACDDMHCVYQGITKKLLELWFDAKYRAERWSLRNSLEIVDNRLCNISPPRHIQRLPRSISENIAFWKASELKAWLLYYSLPVLYGIMDNIYFDHYKLLVSGIFLLSQDSISDNSVNEASMLLTEFVSRFEVLYDRVHLSCNLHQLLHLADTVRDFGPLWVLSCFAFENLNGKLKQLVSGTRYADLQICTAFSVFLNLATLKNERLLRDSPALAFCDRLCGFKHKMKLTALTASEFAVGKLYLRETLPVMVQDALQLAGVEGTAYWLFYRLYRRTDNSVIISESYRRTLKTKSSCIIYGNETKRYGIVQSFVKVSLCRCENLCDDCNSLSFAIIHKCDTNIIFRTLQGIGIPHVHSASFTGEYEAIEIGQLHGICCFIQIRENDKMYFIDLVNSKDAEK